MTLYEGRRIAPRAATARPPGALLPPGPTLQGRALARPRAAQRQDVPAFLNPARLVGAMLRPVRSGAALRENVVLRGTLRDALGRPLAGWQIVVGAELVGAQGERAILSARLAGTGQAGGYEVVIPRASAYAATAWNEAEHVVPVPCTLSSFEGLDRADFTAALTFREGRAFIEDTPTPLRNVRLAWSDPDDEKAWQGDRTDAQGRYALYEEGRAYEVFAIQHNAEGRALFVLSSSRDNPDGTRDLFFRLLAMDAGVEFSSYTGGFVKQHHSDGTFRNLPPEWNFGG